MEAFSLFAHLGVIPLRMSSSDQFIPCFHLFLNAVILCFRFSEHAIRSLSPSIALCVSSCFIFWIFNIFIYLTLGHLYLHVNAYIAQSSFSTKLLRSSIPLRVNFHPNLIPLLVTARVRGQCLFLCRLALPAFTTMSRISHAYMCCSRYSYSYADWLVL